MKDDQEKWLAYLARTGLYQGLNVINPSAQANQLNVANDGTGQQNGVQQLKQIFGPKPLTVRIHYRKMSLFDAPKGSILCHACNAQGVWGSGIAKEFKSKFPKSFKEYNEYCTTNPSYYTDGTTLITKLENGYNVGCLITSSNYGDKLGAESTILINTRHALDQLAQKYINPVFYSNKFNSGFFKVPWEHTEKLIKDFCKKYNRTWIVADPNLVEDEK